MTTECPHCQSTRITTRNVAKKAGGLIGTVGGTASGAAGAINGAKFGGIVGVAGGTAGIALGTLAGAIFGALVGGASGGMAGAKLGELVDDRVLDNHQCLDCGHSFSAKSF